jgi:hypothetical protein
LPLGVGRITRRQFFTNPQAGAIGRQRAAAIALRHQHIADLVITAVFQFKAPYPLGLLLLVGPTLVVSLAILGYKTVRVFYRRFIEAWITSLNVDAMLGLRSAPDLN